MSRLQALSWNRGIIAVALALVPWSGFAQGAIQTFSGTGLEPIRSEPVKKPKTAATTPAGPKPPTEITSEDGMTFDEKSRVSIFSGSVKVNDPQFKLSCDKLTAFLKKGNSDAPGKGGGDEAKPAPSPGTAGDDKSGKKAKGGPAPGGNGLDRALAEGHVVITQDKVDPNGEVTHYIGRGAKADYVTATGDVTLTGWPQIQQGMNNQVATDEKTVMIMNRNGQLRTIGRSKTVIVNQSDLKKSDPEKEDGSDTSAASESSKAQ